MSLAMSLRARGPVGSATRTAKVLSRFGAGASAMTRRLDRYLGITAELGIRPTWPTTACVLARHPDLLRRYAGRGAELALHGLVHGDHAVLDRQQQQTTIARAARIFERAGVRAAGFRGPYLRYNEATLEVLRELGLRYHSSQAVAFPLIDGYLATDRAATSYRLALELYGAVDARQVAVTPRLRHGLVDIPVTIPDDEVLVERLGLAGIAPTAQWRSVLETTYRRGDLFTMQLHPERIEELGEALGATLAEARRRQPTVFIATLDEIALWWMRRSRFTLSVDRSGEGRYRVRFDADRHGTLLARGLATERTAWYGNDALCERRLFEVEGPRMPVVAVSRRTPVSVRRFLAEEGFPLEVSDQANAFGAHVDVSGADWTETEVLAVIDAAPGPLVRVWRWPDRARSALAVTGDIDALTLLDFALRSWETRQAAFAMDGRS